MIEPWVNTFSHNYTVLEADVLQFQRVDQLNTPYICLSELESRVAKHGFSLNSLT